MRSAAASRGAAFSPLHRDFFGHQEDAVGQIEKLLLVGPDHLQAARLGEGPLDLVEAVGLRLCDPVVLRGRAGHVRKGLRNLMALDVGAEVAHKL